MMTITSLHRCHIELSAYLEDIRNDSDYPLERHSTYWYGKLAQQSHLLGRSLSISAVQSAFSGCLGTERIKGKRRPHKSGIDLTFSAPKSVSILALIGQDNRLIDAHDEAVKMTLDHIEADTAQVKVTRAKGKLSYENCSTMLFGLVRHYAHHDENEPQLHTHVLLPNMTRDQEGTLRAFAFCLKQNGDVIHGTEEQIYHYQKYYTALYQGQLAKRAQSLGYITRGTGEGQYEIQGLPQQLISALSSRQYQAEERSFAANNTRTSAKNSVANGTQKSKSPHNISQRFKHWATTTNKLQGNQESIVSHCLSQSHISHNTQCPDCQTTPDLSVLKITHGTLNRALEELSQYKTSFSMRKLIEVAAFGASEDEQANAIDLKREVHNWLKQGLLLPTSTPGLYTTQSMLSIESLLMSVTKGRTRTRQNKVNHLTLDALPLCRQSRQSIARILQSHKQFQIVDIVGSSRQFVEGLLSLGQDASISFHWISSPQRDFVIYPFPLDEPTSMRKGWITEAFSKSQRHILSTLLSTPHYLGYRDVALFEDAGRMSANEITDMSIKAKEAGFKVILLNSHSRHERNNPKSVLDIYTKGNVSAHQWLNTIHTKAKVSVYELDPKAITHLYVNLTDRLHTQLVVTTKSAQRLFTDLIRNALKNTGQLSYHGIKVDTLLPQYLSKPKRGLAHHYTPGMVLRHQRDNKHYDYTIIKHHRRINTVEVCRQKDGQILRWDTAGRTFRSLNLQPMQPQRMTVCLGDILIMKSRLTQHGLQVGLNYVVSRLDEHCVHLKGADNQTVKLTVDALQGTPLEYGYVQIQDNATPRLHTLLFGKCSTLSSKRLGALTRGSRRVDIFTDDPQRTLIKLDKTRYRPLSVKQVIDRVTPNDSYMSSYTTTLLTEDVTQAVNVLGIRLSPDRIGKSVANAISYLSTGQASLTHQALVVETVCFSLKEDGQSIPQTEILDALVSCDNRLSAQYYDGTRWVTTHALQTEKNLHERLEQARGQHWPYLTPDTFHARIVQRHSLPQDQKDALYLVSTTSNSIVAIQGLARAGKLSLLTNNVSIIIDTAKICQVSTDRIIGIVPTRSAVYELGDHGIQAQRLSNLLKEFREKGSHTLPKGVLYYLDTITIVSNQDAVSFTQLLDASYSKAVLLSDTEQRLPLNSGKPFVLAIQRGMIDTAYLIKMTDVTAPVQSRSNIVDRNIKRHQQCQNKSILPHIISISTERTSEDNEAFNSDVSLSWHVAQDYLNRTPETRAHTLIVADSDTQDAISHSIRAGRRERGELGYQEVVVRRLRSIPTSQQALMTTAPYQPGLIVSHKLGHYAEIASVDKVKGLVHTIEHNTSKKVSFFPDETDPATTTLYSLSLQKLSRGDRILSLVSRKALGIRVNIDYEVSEITTQMILAKNHEGHTLTLELDAFSDAHWDYAYTRTPVMSQDCTYPFVITAVNNKRAFAHFRDFHTDLNRVSEHIRLYTYIPKALMLQWFDAPLVNHDNSREH